MPSNITLIGEIQCLNLTINANAKKLHLAEFQELGFLVNFQFAEGTAIETVDETVDRFINEVIQPNGLAYEGSGYLHWEGLVCLEKIGKCDESHRETVKNG